MSYLFVLWHFSQVNSLDYTSCIFSQILLIVYIYKDTFTSEFTMADLTQ